MNSRSGLDPISRLIALAITGAFFFDATARSISQPGLSTFGRPPELAILWATLGLLALLLVGGAKERLVCARRLTLLVLLVCLFSGQAIHAAPELSLALTGATLFVAAPLLRPRLLAAAVLALLVCSLPSILATPYPQGAVSWLTALLPPASLAVLLPSLFPGQHIRKPAIVFVAGTALLSLAALSSYATLAQGIHLPISSLLSTRLRPMGMHPNLAVPQLLTALLIACGLAWDFASTRRGWFRAAALILAVTLAAVQSRTGSLGALLGLGILVGRRLPLRPARLLHPIICVGVVIALLLPTTGLGRGSIEHASTDRMQKAVSFRSAMWQIGRETFHQAPWYGFGPESTYKQSEFAQPSRYDGLPKDDHPHNIVLAVGSALGWPGLLGLAALLALSLRRTRNPGLLSDAASAALLVTWASHSVDMGGATSTLYPSLVFLLLGLKHAADQTGEETNAKATSLAAGPILLGLALILAGGSGWAGRLHTESVTKSVRLRHGEAPHPTAASLPFDLATRLQQKLATAGRLRPFDPDVALIQARVAERSEDSTQQVDFLREALRLHPESARIMHELAVQLARQQPRDPEVLQLLEGSVQRDALGPSSSDVLVDLAIIYGGHGDSEQALSALVAALTLNPSAIQRVPWEPQTERLTLGWAGSEGVRIPLSRVLLAIARERVDRGESDPATHTRMQMREIEIYAALGDYQRADEISRRILPNNHVYRHSQLGSSALQRGDYDLALEEFSQVDMSLYFAVRVNGLVAMSEASDLDPETFAELSTQLESHLPDVLFEAATLRRILRARQRVAERLLNPEEALGWSDALEYASR
ncbi:MAG: O-antigen ligase family protein [Planctomycetota bacterium]|nr:O-antigen ligase family protein [Planctomycetota bacterium]